MTFDPKSYYVIAEYLVDNINDLPDEIGDEAARRSAINRYYYSISTGTHLLLINNFKDTDYEENTSKNHGLLRNHLWAIGTREARLLTADLNRMLNHRKSADYTYPLSMRILRMTLRSQSFLATEAQTKLDRLLAAYPIADS